MSAGGPQASLAIHPGDKLVEVTSPHNIRPKGHLAPSGWDHSLNRGVEANDDPPLLVVEVYGPGTTHELAFVHAHLSGHQLPTIRIEVPKLVERGVSFIGSVLNMASVGLQDSHVPHLEANPLEES
jgi:hypothetical protein